MKFFSEFGSCCRAPMDPDPAVGAGGGSGRGGRAPRSGRNGLIGSRVDCSTHWKPALSVISEDSNVSAAARNGVRTVRTVKKSPGTVGSRDRVREPSYGDEFRKSPMPMVIPVFSPTPFMF